MNSDLGGTSCTPHALTDVGVVEIGGGWAGLLLSKLLHEQGASVVRIRGAALVPAENRVHDRVDRALSSSFRTISVAHDAGPETIIDVVAGADVLIDALPTGRWKELGIPPDRLEERCSGLIRVALPGFPSIGAEERDMPSWEGGLGAATGLFTDVDLVRGFLGLPPVYSALPYASVYSAIHAAIAVSAALLARARGRERGQRIEVPLAAAGLSAMSTQMLRVDAQPHRYDVPFVPRWFRDTIMPLVRLAMSVAPNTIGEAAGRLCRRLTPPLMDSYRCRDGALLYLFAMDHDRTARELLEHLGCLDALRSAGLQDGDAYGPAARDNLREGGLLSAAWRRRIRAALAERLSERDAEDWERDLSAAGFACAVQRTTDAWLGRPELAAQGVIETKDIPPIGRVRRPGPAVWLRRFGEKTEPEPSARREGKGLLSGVRVLDLSAVVAGPVAARTLAEYGADVIKIVSRSPHHGPRITCWYAIDVDRGKRSIAVDLTSEGGHEILRRLLARTDIVVHNFTDGAVARLGLTPEELGEIRPGIIVSRIGAFRGPRPGPWSDRRGYDPVLQAASGIMSRYGDPGRPEHHGIASCIDFVTGFAAAFGAVLALLARRSGDGGAALVAETGLAQGALMIQGPYAVEIEGVLPEAPAGKSAKGMHALDRLYRARDGWVFLAAPADQLPNVSAAVSVELPRNASVYDTIVAHRLGRAIRRRSHEELVRLLHACQVAILPVKRLDERRSEWLSDRQPGDLIEDGPIGQIIRSEHPAGGYVDVLAPGWTRIEGTPLRIPTHAPKAGADTESVLQELGYNAEDIEALLKSGVAATGLSDRYLPE